MDRILVLGGYGSTGRQWAEKLLCQASVRLVVAGQRQGNAREMAARLNAGFDGERVTAAYADAADRASLDGQIEPGETPETAPFFQDAIGLTPSG